MKKNDKIVPAGPGEKIQYLTHDLNDNTIRFALCYPGLPCPRTMCGAMAAVIAGADVLHSSFLPGNLGAYWRVNRDYAEEDYFTRIDTDGDPMDHVQREMLRSIPPDSKVLMHCSHIMGRDSSALVLTISHLCVDGGDGRYLLQKLTEAYGLIARTGNADGLLIKDGSRAPEQLYGELTPKQYLSLMKPGSSPLKTPFPFPAPGQGSPHLEITCIPAPVMDAARARAKKEGATANDLLLTACYCALVSLPGMDAGQALSIMSMMDLRRHCRNGESDGLCNMSGFMPTLLPEGVRGGFSHTLGELAAQTRKAKEDPLAGMAGLPLAHMAARTAPLHLLLKVSGHIYGNLSIGLTNLGNIPGDSLALDGLRPSSGLFAGPLKKKPAMQISAAGFDNAVMLCSIGEFEEEDAGMLRTMLEGMVREVTDYAEG